MTKDQYLSDLKNRLSSLSLEERNDILRDQEELIREAMAAGRTEESVIQGLGDPKSLASALTAQKHINKATHENSLASKFKLTMRAMVAVLALAPLNFLFLLGPVLIVGCLLFSAWATLIALGAVSFAGYGALITYSSLIPFAPLGHLASFSFITGSLGVTILVSMLLWLICKMFLNMLLSYLQWNVEFVQKQVRS